MSQPPATFRFGDFVLDVAAYTLRRKGQPIRLERRPMDLLILLVQHHGELVPRAAIIERLWGEGVFVDAEMGINTAIRKIRQVLGDAPEVRTFIETVPGKGYRFVGDIETAAVAPTLGSTSATLAVLPFENLGARQEHDYLADGFTEEATTALGRIDPDRLSVIGRTSVLSYRRTTKSLAEIGRELNATYLVEGSIRAEVRRWRVTVRLIRASDQVQVWSASFDSEPRSILDFQRQLSTAVAEQVRLRLSPDRLAALQDRQSRSVEAYDLYLRGRHLWNQLTPQTNRAALEYYARATALDAQYSLAWAGMADLLAASPMTADTVPLEVWPRARDAAAHAVATGPDIAESQTARGMVSYWLDWEWVAAEDAYRKAVALDPSYALAHRMLGVLLATDSRHEEAHWWLRRARELDPLQPMMYALSAHVALLARNDAAGLEFARQATVIGPAFWIGFFQLAWAYERLGEVQLALEALHQAEVASGGNSKMISLRGYILARAGRRGEAEEVLSALEGIAQHRYVPPYALAVVHVGLGNHERAMDWLQHAYNVRDVHVIWLPTDPKLDPLRSETAFVRLIERCNFRDSGAARVTSNQ